MPKIIENVKEKALEEARKILLLEEGYEGLTIRAIAAKLGVATGTIYNYFPSKDYLTASVMLKDWQSLMGALKRQQPAKGEEAAEALRPLYEAIQTFSKEYRTVWQQAISHPAVHQEQHQWHQPLVNQMKVIIEQNLGEKVLTMPFLSDFLAESILKFASDGNTEFDTLKPIINKLTGV